MLKGSGIPLLRIALSIFMAAAVTLGALNAISPQPASASSALLKFPSSDCGGDSVQVTFNWHPVDGAVEQWLDLSLEDNRFAHGTYQPFHLASGQSSLTTTPLSTNTPHYWRINSRTSAGWVESKLGQFVPCGGPQLLWGPTICQSADLAAVNFNWAPRSDTLGYQFIEISNDDNFGANVTSIGPLAASASEFRRGGFRIDERTFFRLVWEGFDGTRITTWTASFVPDCTTETVNSALYSSPDRLVSTDLGINAPVNVRDVGFDGFLGNPSGAFDVVRYNFVGLPTMRGYPGNGGVTTIGGHVDYYSVGLAIFAPLRSAHAGQIIEYHRADGIVVRYQVDWTGDVPFNQNLNGYLLNKGPDELILVTCNGRFDQSVGRYDQRRLVHAVRIN